jgi:LmbE family N-acetylglucosaminyl deacetylase
MTQYIFLSPHLDDAVLSCGAVIYDLIHQKHESVEIWTIFAGAPPEGPISTFAKQIHERWNTGDQADAKRRAEDDLACERLDATPRHLAYPDCIYRFHVHSDVHLIMNNDDLFGEVSPEEEPLINEIAHLLQKEIPPGSRIVLPLGVGSHIDHLITRQAAEKLSLEKYYYADFPYAGGHPEEIARKLPGGAKLHPFQVGKPGLTAWQYAAEAYTSQVSTFWSSLGRMYQAIQDYSRSELGHCLWKID